MKHTRWIALPLGLLILATLACGGGGEPTSTPVPPPTEPPPTQPPPPPPTGLDYTLEPNFGEVELESGFVPDPHEVMIVSGGDVDIDELDLGGGCTGYATSAPDFRIFLSGDSPGIRIFFVPDEEGEDATLVVNTATADWVCNDDYSDWNPLVEIEEPPDGQYDVWVGSWSSSDFISGRLFVTELDLGPEDYTGGGDGGELDYTLEPNFGEVELESGFVPDPHEVMVLSGGDVDVDELDLGGGCTGYATSAPDFRIFLSGDSPGIRIFFVPDEEGEDATLVVNTATAGWVCNDDYSGWDPLVEIEEPPDGQYDVWVGSWSSSDFISGRVFVTELDLGPEDYAGGGGGGAGEIAQWAYSATASSQWGSGDDFAPLQATGVPDTDECGDISTAWASSSSSGVDWLELTYLEPVIPTEINIFETHSPGCIVEVEVIDEDGLYTTIWEDEPEVGAQCPRVFSLTVLGVDFAVVGVRINLDQSTCSWNEIDAVELVGLEQ